MTFHLDRLRVDPVPPHEPRARRRASSRACSTPGRPRCGRCPVVLAIVVVIGLQLLPERSGRASAVPHRDARPVCWARARRPDPVVGATVPEPGRRPLHLLPLLTWPTTTQPHEPLRPSRPARFRARDGDHRRCSSRVAARGHRGRLGEAGGRADGPGLGRDVVLAVGKPAGWVADGLPFAAAADDATAWLSPDDELDGGGCFDGGSRAAGRARRRRSRPTRSSRPTIGAKPPARKRR